MKSFLFLLFFSASFLISSTASAQVSIHGGGHGIVIGGKVYLLDLVEKNIHTNPSFEMQPMSVDYFRFAPTRIGLDYSRFNLDLKMLDFKLTGIAYKDPVFAMAILKTIHNMSWSLVPYPLKLVQDDSPLRTEKPADLQIVQVALRTGNDVRINQDLLAKMDRENIVALFIHEAVAALAAPQLTSPYPVRSLVSSLFDPQFALTRGSVFQSQLALFPNVTNFTKTLGINSSEILFENVEIKQLTYPADNFVFVPGDFLPEYFFAPVVKLKTLQIDETVFVTTTNKKSVLERLANCSSVSGTRIEVGYYTVESFPRADIVEGATWPRHDIKAVYHQRAVLPPLPCSGRHQDEISIVSEWLRLQNVF